MEFNFYPNINSLRPNGTQHQISPNNITVIWNVQVKRMNEMMANDKN